MTRAILAAALLPILAACGNGGPPEPDLRVTLQTECFERGGAYFEYESTSAGSHVWCVGPDGAEIQLDGGE